MILTHLLLDNWFSRYSKYISKLHPKKGSPSRSNVPIKMSAVARYILVRHFGARCNP